MGISVAAMTMSGNGSDTVWEIQSNSSIVVSSGSNVVWKCAARHHVIEQCQLNLHLAQTLTFLIDDCGVVIFCHATTLRNAAYSNRVKLWPLFS